jgi:hypothetical protein
MSATIGTQSWYGGLDRGAEFATDLIRLGVQIIPT